MYGPEFEKKVDTIVARYPQPKAAMLPVLWEVQKAKGWIDSESEVWVGERLGVSPAHVHGTVTFYTMYKQQPSGKYHIQVCTTLSCMLRGSDELVQHLADISGESVEARPEPRAETSYRCPKCPDQKLQEAYLLDVRVESCPGCDGIFLDLGEVHELLGALSSPELATGSALAGFDHFALGLFVGMRRGREE